MDSLVTPKRATEKGGGMIRFIHTADIHLDSPLRRLEQYEGAPVDEIRQASRRAMENLIELAISESVDFVIIAGDLFDGDWPDTNTGLYFVRQMRRLHDARIPVFIASGNHDAESKITRKLPYPENVHVFSTRKPGTKTLEGLKVAVHGQSFPHAAVMDNLALAYPEPVPGHINIGVLHTSLNGREGHAGYAPCTQTNLHSRGYDYWALGHVHQYEIVSDDPPIVFPGCIQGRHIRETGAKGCVVVSLAEGAAPDIVHHPLDVIRWDRVAIDLTGVGEMSEALKQSRRSLEALMDRHSPLPVVIRVAVTGETALHDRLLADPDAFKDTLRAESITACGERAWIEKVGIQTTAAGRAAPAPGPLKEMADLVAQVAADDDELLAVGEALSDLLKKVPPDYRQGEDRLRLDDPGQLRGIVLQAHALLVRRLRKEAAAS